MHTQFLKVTFDRLTLAVTRELTVTNFTVDVECGEDGDADECDVIVGFANVADLSAAIDDLPDVDGRELIVQLLQRVGFTDNTVSVLSCDRERNTIVGTVFGHHMATVLMAAAVRWEPTT